MEEVCGTKYLITNREADRFLDRANRYGTERYEKWCGGREGFDDFCERLH
jgi:hypothetical protein